MIEGAIDVPGLAHAYRRLVLWFGAQLLLNCGSQFGVLLPEQGAGQLALALVVFAGALITVVALVYYGYKTAEALASARPVLWAIAMLLPCVNVITLLVLSSKATSACRANGIPVGLLGPKV